VAHQREAQRDSSRRCNQLAIAGAQSSRGQCRTHVIVHREAPLGGRDHRLEARIMTQGIEIRIDFGVIQEASRELFKYRSEQFKCGVRIAAEKSVSTTSAQYQRISRQCM
jgi:hypothetical protein